MNIVTGIVLYAVIWFMTLFVVLPMRMTSQRDDGKRLIGTHASAPADPQMRRRFIVTSIVAFVIWVIIAGIIISGVVSIADIDLFTRFGMGAP